MTETSFGAKKDFLVYLKTYMKNVAAKLEEQGKGDQVDEFKKNIQPYVSELMKSFKDLMFFVGKSTPFSNLVEASPFRTRQQFGLPDDHKGVRVLRKRSAP